MTADIRTAARTEAFNNHYSHKQVRDRYDADLLIAGFQEGAVWAAARGTPTREQVMDELRRHKLVHVSVSRKGAFCMCNSSVKAGMDANLEWFEAHRADAILALLAGLAEGESD